MTNSHVIVRSSAYKSQKKGNNFVLFPNTSLLTAIPRAYQLLKSFSTVLRYISLYDESVYIQPAFH